MIWLAIALPLLLFLYWLLVITEGAYLGSQVVAWLYDLSAGRYDAIKQFDLNDENYFLALPLLRALNGVRAPIVLDVATGTGRLPLALLRHSGFRGKVIGLDLSRRMLRLAQHKAHHHRARLYFIRQDAAILPFADNVFDAVTCVEALEFLANPRGALQEMARVLRPGGVLLVTNRVNWEARLMPGKAFSNSTLRAMLESVGLSRIEIRHWQVCYDLVWAWKN
ncbi:MAG: class I SAM-dependent methyltransferase [Anaerolineae bacterium]|jgi:ubiquinone/menaquinone biosynthesis C-methylase UbiE|nr:class I SAM-dependent methyltransferase [Anaerolineae bacterium]MDH7474651.1 class I SAM-dependent methyltransferase [Anaerolineae bacterium]